MYQRIVRTISRSIEPAEPENERALSAAALQSLRDYRRKRIANRRLVSQPKAA